MAKKLIIGAVILVLVVVALIFLTPLLDIIGLGDAGLCTENPFNSGCSCPSDFDKIEVSAYGVPKFICETKNKFIDPDDVDWEEQSIDYAKQTLADNFPDCNMNDCSQGDWVIEWGVFETEKRIISAECWAFDTRFSEVEFDISDGAVSTMSCSDYQEPQPGEPTILFTYVGLGAGGDKYRYKVKCTEGTGTATGEVINILTEDRTDASGWSFPGGDTVKIIPTPTINSGTCELINPESRQVTISCSAECTGFGDWGGELRVGKY